MFQLTLLNNSEVEIKNKPVRGKAANDLKALFTSNSDDWATDPVLFNTLNKIFSFEIDLTASFDNNKCKFYYFSICFAFIPCLREAWIRTCAGIIAHSSLTAPWQGRGWLNPPYSNIEIWAEKAFKSKTFICFLIPARTDTRYFKNFCYKARYIVYLYGRQKFGKGRAAGRGSAPFPSCLVLFGLDQLTNDQLTALAKIGQVTENLQPRAKRKIITRAKDLK